MDALESAKENFESSLKFILQQSDSTSAQSVAFADRFNEACKKMKEYFIALEAEPDAEVDQLKVCINDFIILYLRI